jgi:hypothetical protein
MVLSSAGRSGSNSGPHSVAPKSFGTKDHRPLMAHWMSYLLGCFRESADNVIHCCHLNGLPMVLTVQFSSSLELHTLGCY